MPDVPLEIAVRTAAASIVAGANPRYPNTDIDFTPLPLWGTMPLAVAPAPLTANDNAAKRQCS